MKIALLLTLSAAAALCQQAQISGVIQDPSGLGVAGATIGVRSEETGGQRTTRSNDAGFYSVVSLKPGTWRISIRAMGFETIVQEEVKLEVGDNARLDFAMRIGDSRTVVIVKGGPPLINTEDASVGTVIGRNIIDQMPLNGRGIQSLIELTPGVEVVPVVTSNAGQFTVNGQRSDANYFTVDGVSANFAAGIVNTVVGGVYSVTGQTGGATLPANNLLGTLSNLVSPDALQEFKIQTSTFAPEFGRTPGAQIGFVTRSGTTQYSGSLFEYFRNDILDANGWFNNYHSLPKPPLRFNNFGASLGGPLGIPRVFKLPGQTFFFFSFEDLDMRQPQPVVPFAVPDQQTRLSASPLVASLLNAVPLPNRPAAAAEISTPGWGAYAQSFSSPTTQQTWGLRLDHYFNDKVIGFLRYNLAPSNITQYNFALPLDAIRFSAHTTTLTSGLTFSATPTLVNELRANISWQNVTSSYRLLSLGGAQQPSDAVLFPAGYSARDSFTIVIDSEYPGIPETAVGTAVQNYSRQLQFVDQLSWLHGSHQWKFGADYRLFRLLDVPPRTDSNYDFLNLSSGIAFLAGTVYSPMNVTYQVPSVSLYAQDTWHVSQKLTLTYGVRWEIDPAPRVSSGDVSAFRELTNVTNFGTLVPAPQGTPFYRTDYTAFAPRLGLAWQIRDSPFGKTVLRLGSGVFYDLGQSEFENPPAQSSLSYNYANVAFGNLPTKAPTPEAGSSTVAVAGYTLPRTYQWNVTLEQSFGQQTFSAAYLGAIGHHLPGVTTGDFFNSPTNILTNVHVEASVFSSAYNSLQLQFNRRLSRRLQALVSYTWSHSIDNLSSETGDDLAYSNVTVLANPNINRGSSDFDVRHSLHGALFASLPAPNSGRAAVLLRNWTASSIFFVRSALPTDILTIDDVRPDLVPGQPLYLYSASYPGGKSYNYAAFTNPPSGALEGDLGRNVLRGFGAWQVDLALHRQFHLSERAGLQFRAEAFNVFNHPNFANPSLSTNPNVAFAVPGFGLSQGTLASALTPVGTLGELSPLFQIGGPRVLQFALRLTF
jgi:Carboxypeptidase regulatory-like domain/TonB dependent receptor